MKHLRILLHAFLAMVPVLLGRWLARQAFHDAGMMEFVAYNCALLFVILAVIGLGSFVPQLLLVACRNSQHASMDEFRMPVPVHPVGWVTVLGVWGHIPALWIAANLSGDLYSVSFSFLGPPLILASFLLSRRWVERASPSRPAKKEIDGLGPHAHEF